MSSLHPQALPRTALGTPPGPLQRQVRHTGVTVRMTIDPCDGRRALISGRMGEVCDALDRLIQQQGLALA